MHKSVSKVVGTSVPIILIILSLLLVSGHSCEQYNLARLEIPDTMTLEQVRPVDGQGLLFGVGGSITDTIVDDECLRFAFIGYKTESGARDTYSSEYDGYYTNQGCVFSADTSVIPAGSIAHTFTACHDGPTAVVLGSVALAKASNIDKLIVALVFGGLLWLTISKKNSRKD